MTTTQIPGSRDLPIFIDARIHAKQAPVVIFCHGYKGFKDWGAWNLVGDSFCDSGFNFVKFNFSYNGCMEGALDDFPNLEAFGNNNYSTEVNDLNLVIDWVHNGADGALNQGVPIFLIGHSRGGAIVILGSSENQNIDGVCTWSGVSDFDARFPFGEDLKRWKKDGVYHVENKRTNQQMPHFYQFFQDFQSHSERLDIRRAARSLSLPFLILHGSDDEAVHFTEAMRLKKWAMHAQLEIISPANHTYGSYHPYDQDHLPSALDQAVKSTLDFFNDAMS